MSKVSWYVHIQGENIGPLSTANVSSMLQQNRLQFVDFIWSESLTKWHRIMDLDQFASLMPQYPKTGIPDTQKAAPSAEAPAAKAAPKKAPTPTPAKPTRPALGKFHRVQAHGAKVQIEELGAFDVVNISEGGVFLASDKPPYVGTEVAFQLELPGRDKKLDMTGVVIRHGHAEETVGFAIEFTRLNPAHKRLLRDCIAEWIKEK